MARWMMDGRPNNKAGKSFVKRERRYLQRWADIVRLTVTNYCKKHDLRVPNRMTTVQPAGTKSCSLARRLAGILPRLSVLFVVLPSASLIRWSQLS